jgi:hypothetical protein
MFVIELEGNQLFFRRSLVSAGSRTFENFGTFELQNGVEVVAVKEYIPDPPKVPPSDLPRELIVHVYVKQPSGLNERMSFAIDEVYSGKYTEQRTHRVPIDPSYVEFIENLLTR